MGWQIPAGLLADRVGGARVLVAGLAIWSLATATTALVSLPACCDLLLQHLVEAKPHARISVKLAANCQIGGHAWRFPQAWPEIRCAEASATPKAMSCSCVC